MRHVLVLIFSVCMLGLAPKSFGQALDPVLDRGYSFELRDNDLGSQIRNDKPINVLTLARWPAAGQSAQGAFSTSDLQWSPDDIQEARQRHVLMFNFGRHQTATPVQKFTFKAINNVPFSSYLENGKVIEITSVSGAGPFKLHQRIAIDGGGIEGTVGDLLVDGKKTYVFNKLITGGMSGEPVPDQTTVRIAKSSVAMPSLDLANALAKEAAQTAPKAVSSAAENEARYLDARARAARDASDKLGRGESRPSPRRNPYQPK